MKEKCLDDEALAAENKTKQQQKREQKLASHDITPSPKTVQPKKVETTRRKRILSFELFKIK